MLLNLVKDSLTLLSKMRTFCNKMQCCLWFETMWALVVKLSAVIIAN